MKNLTKKTWMALMVLALLATMTLPAAASEPGTSEETSFWEDVRAAGSDLYQSAKENVPGWWQSARDAASDVADTVKENGPEWIEAAGEKGSELLEQGKDALQNAGDKVSGFLEDQQDQFWERTEQQINGGSGSNPATGATPEISTPVDSVPDVMGGDASSALNETGSTSEDSATDGSMPPVSTSGEEAPEADMTFAWMAISLGLAAVACGCLYALRDKPEH